MDASDLGRLTCVQQLHGGSMSPTKRSLRQESAGNPQKGRERSPEKKEQGQGRKWDSLLSLEMSIQEGG